MSNSTPKNTLIGNSLIWFGAAVSIAEILTGTLLAPLGIVKAAIAIILGHLIGGVLLCCAGFIGAKHSLSAMESVKRTFGTSGGKFFALLNVIQLAGWTAVMIAAGAQSACGIWQLPNWLWCVITGMLVALWITLNPRELKVLNLLAVALLFSLSVILSVIIFRKPAAVTPLSSGSLSFGEALELSIAMPLSWLPLIADYTCNSNRPKTANLLSSTVYFAISCWMYFIGLGAALYAGGADITLILSRAGLGIPALLIVIFSTVTTTYLDVYSAGMSMLSINRKIPALFTKIAVCLIGTLLAVFCQTGAFEEFLYWIGSVFAPMIAIQIADFFLLKKRQEFTGNFNLPALIIWGAGFILYRCLLSLNPLCGSTLPVMLVSAVLYLLWRKAAK